jgi:hypothetical protein
MHEELKKPVAEREAKEKKSTVKHDKVDFPPYIALLKTEEY